MAPWPDCRQVAPVRTARRTPSQGRAGSGSSSTQGGQLSDPYRRNQTVTDRLGLHAPHLEAQLAEGWPRVGDALEGVVGEGGAAVAVPGQPAAQ